MKNELATIREALKYSSIQLKEQIKFISVDEKVQLENGITLNKKALAALDKMEERLDSEEFVKKVAKEIFEASLAKKIFGHEFEEMRKESQDGCFKEAQAAIKAVKRE